MNIEDLCKYLFIDEGYNIEYIKRLADSDAINESGKVYGNLQMLFKELETDGLKGSRQKIKYNDDSFQDMDNSDKDNELLYDDNNEDLELEEAENTSDELNKKVDFILMSEFSGNNQSILFQIELFKTNLRILSRCGEYTNQRLKLRNALKLEESSYDENLLEIFRNLTSRNLLKRDPRRSLSFFVFDFKRYIRKVLENKSYDYDTYLIFKFHCQAIMLVLNMLNQDDNYIEKEALSYMSYCIASCMRMAKNTSQSETLYFAKNSLLIKESDYRQWAYSILGKCASSMHDWQLANDAYVTWLNKKPVGEIDSILGVDYSWDSKEDEWRCSEKGMRQMSIMHGSLARVCGEISQTYEIASTQERKFYNLAKENLKSAINLNPKNEMAYYRFGQLLSSDMTFDLGDLTCFLEYVDVIKQALQCFDEYKQITKDSSAIYKIMRSNRMLCNSLQKLIFLEWVRNKDNYSWTDEINDLYKDLQKNTSKYYKLSDEYREIDKMTNREFEIRDDLYSILNFPYNENNSPLLRKIHVLLISIGCDISMLKSYLHRREYITTDYYSRVCDNDEKREKSKEIAYYTTLKTLSHIFDELYIDEKGNVRKDDSGNVKDTKNCLTVMNAKYMNDPNEGITILKALLNPIGDCELLSKKKPKVIIKDIYDENFVFLKSFTERIDNLTMWNRYANDYNDEGNNSNGCCAIFNPGSFANGSNVSLIKNRTTNAGISDDYSLYRIVYLSNDGSIDKLSNPGLNNNVYVLYDNLKLLFEQLNDCVQKYLKGRAKNKKIIEKHINEILIKFLRDIVFLFKHVDYSDEQESRLILFRNSNQQNDIRVIPGAIPLLALNPFFQVYIDKIIFGPNVRNAEKWRPYFQYELNKMWEKHKSIINNKIVTLDQKDRIDNSEIDYWT